MVGFFFAFEINADVICFKLHWGELSGLCIGTLIPGETLILGAGGCVGGNGVRWERESGMGKGMRKGKGVR